MARTAVTSEHHLRSTFSALAGLPLSEYETTRQYRIDEGSSEVNQRCPAGCMGGARRSTLASLSVARAS